jgi:hypothetical protein
MSNIISGLSFITEDQKIAKYIIECAFPPSLIKSIEKEDEGSDKPEIKNVGAYFLEFYKRTFEN